MIKITPWKDHVVITIPVYREWTGGPGPIREVHIWTDHHWGESVSKI
jgi:GTP cyclohydrolase III